MLADLHTHARAHTHTNTHTHARTRAQREGLPVVYSIPEIRNSFSRDLFVNPYSGQVEITFAHNVQVGGLGTPEEWKEEHETGQGRIT